MYVPFPYVHTCSFCQATLVEEKDDLARRKATSDQTVTDLETRLAGETKMRLAAEDAIATLRLESENLKKVGYSIPLPGRICLSLVVES